MASKQMEEGRVKKAQKLAHNRFHVGKSRVNATCPLCLAEYPELNGPQFLMGRFPIVVDTGVVITKDERMGVGSPYPPVYNVTKVKTEKAPEKAAGGRRFTEEWHTKYHTEKLYAGCPYCEDMPEEKKEVLRQRYDAKKRAEQDKRNLEKHVWRLKQEIKSAEEEQRKKIWSAPREPMPWETKHYPVGDITAIAEKENHNPRNKELSGEASKPTQKVRFVTFSDEALEILTQPGEVGDDTITSVIQQQRAIAANGPIPPEQRIGLRDVDQEVDRLMGIKGDTSEEELVEAGIGYEVVRP